MAREFAVLSLSNLFLTSSSSASCDAGQTVHADDSQLNDLMQKAGEKMNLRVTLFLC